MEDWKSSSDFTQGIKKLQEAKDCLDSAKIYLLKARDSRLIELRTKKEKLNELLSSLKKQKEDTQKEFQEKCGKIGHSYKVIKKKLVGKGKRRAIKGYEFIYNYTEQCKVCGFIHSSSQTYSNDLPLSKKHNALIETYNSKISKIDSKINEVMEELEKLECDFVEICNIFGHDLGEPKPHLGSDKVKCICCEEEFFYNDFSSIYTDFSRFLSYPRHFYTLLDK